MAKDIITTPQPEAIEAGAIALKQGGKVTWEMSTIHHEQPSKINHMATIGSSH